MIYKLYREQQLQTDIQTAWDFFSSPYNLATITPKEMAFKVKSQHDGQAIYQGLLIDYTVSPLLSIPLKWQTEITDVENLKSFTDFQKKGPYKLWKHHHNFIPTENGVLMQDTVYYELPFGILGKLVHFLFVKKRISQIFDYRYIVLEKMFNQN